MLKEHWGISVLHKEHFWASLDIPCPRSKEKKGEYLAIGFWSLQRAEGAAVASGLIFYPTRRETCKVRLSRELHGFLGHLLHPWGSKKHPRALLALPQGRKHQSGLETQRQDLHLGSARKKWASFFFFPIRRNFPLIESLNSVSGRIVSLPCFPKRGVFLPANTAIK